MLIPGLLEADQSAALDDVASLAAISPIGLLEIPAWPASWAGPLSDALAATTGLVCTQSTAIRDGWDAGAPQSAAAGRARRELAEAAELASAIGGSTVAMWAGRAVEPSATHRRALVDTVRWLLDRYPDLDLVLEPFPAVLMAGSWVETAQDAATLCQEVGPRLQVMYDCSHEVAGGQPSVPAPDVVEQIGVVQLTSPWWSAATGFEDRHPPFGTPGAISWEAAKDRLGALLAAGVSGPVTLEVKAAAARADDDLMARVRRWGEELDAMLAGDASRRVTPVLEVSPGTGVTGDRCRRSEGENPASGSISLQERR